MNTVREVLEYLLEHDDPWKLDPGEKFLCNRCLDMQIAGLIEPELSGDTQRWIMTKIAPCLTLREYDHTTSIYDAGWPSIRQDYLRQWINELKEKEDEQK